VLEIEARSRRPLAPDAEHFAELAAPRAGLELEIYPRRLRIDEDTMHACVHSTFRAVLASTVVDPEPGEYAPLETCLADQYLQAVQM
jgi:hypothetical protein